ncbi:imidazoleglycerol-phosphate dehydratase HisB [Clostridium weizhouense]|uniref:Imidazoleglycerol-phosphate dehydratase n=1 Tax=Clostridium weizhouense TaxID=2859781 RepID=A0ABS7AKI1_9CLOT|nr:imidazoleglycerol-phosphate dehydratase HisB [Clostridium weizhouense]
MVDRISKIQRKTNETNIMIEINLDGSGKSEINTGIAFLDHMLNLFSFHSKIDINILADGDLEVCDHHTVEDIGIVLGLCLKEALGDKKGINRYGTFYLPMDETLVLISLDISGRPFLVFDCEFKRENIGGFSTEMVEEFFRAFAFNAGVTLHCKLLYGSNDHHKIEALFKGLGRAINEAKERNGFNDIPSTKGLI